jgi:hypothetical protein
MGVNSFASFQLELKKSQSPPSAARVERKRQAESIERLKLESMEFRNASRTKDTVETIGTRDGRPWIEFRMLAFYCLAISQAHFNEIIGNSPTLGRKRVFARCCFAWRSRSPQSNRHENSLATGSIRAQQELRPPGE